MCANLPLISVLCRLCTSATMPVNFLLAVNLRTARALDIQVPPTRLVCADR